VTGGRSASGIRSLGPAGIGVVLNLALTAILTAFLLVATTGATDAVPRPFVLAALLSTPAVVAAMGIARRRRSLLAAAAAPLVPASLLSWAMVTLPFAIVAMLYLAGVWGIPRAVETPPRRALHLAQAAGVAGLVLAAGWAVLFGFARNTCVEIPFGSSCSSAAISIEGAVIAGGLLIGAIALAAVGGRRPARP